ncbi:MAG: DNA mismatch repair protein MutL [Haliscomenobacter sp.]|jgi:DNA mismatch repair protein MutL|nr:DNA mismatch repair protein MutL [Haliscomenobacter sp.]
MADIIQLLPDAIANQIAAGEVVQRPASAVKELMENAVDAGSTQIKLILKDAGKSLVQVIDNGCGMSPTDARMSFERHATSKIRAAEDLFAIRTMGFRGEALASIAAVAQVEMKTRLYAEEVGTRLVVEDSAVKVQEPCQTAPGTSIAIRNLFYTIPARRNFLKSDTVELRHILDEFQRIAIANPDIQFVAHHNNTELFHLPPGNLRQRLISVFGVQVNKRLVPLGEETDIAKIRGFIGKPEFAKKTRGEQMFFVNGRFIRSSYLNHAVMAAYEDLLPKDSFPLYVVFIDIDPSMIDVNVHPTKQEIKFDDERLVYNYLRVAVRHALGKYGVMPSLDFEQENTFNLPPIAFSGGERFPQDRVTPKGTAWSESGQDREAQARQQENLANWKSLYASLDTREEQEQEDAAPVTLSSNWDGEQTLEPLSDSLQKVQKAPLQVHGAYILSQIKSGFILIDQQAAHERILFEKYEAVLKQGSGVTQRQLFPKTLHLGPQDSLMLKAILEEVNALGFDIQEFGQHTFVIHGVPAEMAGQQDELRLVEQLLEQYKSGLALQLDLAKNLARSMARSAAIRRGQHLSEAEMQNLTDRLFACENPYTSPFGRKCFVTYDLEDLEKQFSK